MDMNGKVRRMKLRDQLSLSEIAKRTGLSRNTVKKWLRAPGDAVPKYERTHSPGKLTPFEPVLHQALATDSHRPKQGRRSGRALFAQIQAQGYRGGYSAVTDYIRRWRVESAASPAKAFVPLSFELGEAFQFDWSDEAMVVGGVFYNVQVAHLKLCASRAFWLVAYPSQGHEMLFDAHTRSFQALGGVARRGIYDNMRTAVDKVQRGKQRIVNARFSAMCSHYLFDPDFCNVASGWEKGVVEKNVQDSRRRIWIEAATRRFGSFTELNAWLGERCRSVWADTAHPIHRQFTVAEMWELEKDHLMPMPAPFDGYVERLARVSSTCLVAAARNRYSVPCEWAGHIVSTRVYLGRIDVAAADMVVASHARLPGSGQTTYDWQHYIDLVQRKPGALRNGAPFLDLPAPLLRLRQSLLRHPGGDRVMAQVLAVVAAFADKVLTPERLREMLKEMKAYLKIAGAREEESIRVLQKELNELELATNRLYEAVEKDLLPMDEMLRERSRKLKARRDAVMLEMAGARRQKEMPASMLTAKQLESFGTALRSRLMDSGSGATKRYLHQFVGEIRFDGKRVLMRGKKAALLEAAVQKDMGTTRVPISVHSWLLDLGSNQGPTD